MHSRLISLLTVIGAVTVLVLAGNTVALAATGKGFLLGKINTANKITVLKRTTPGTALKVVTKSATSAPLQVNGTGKVANLNADTVDGLDSSAFAPASLATTVSGLAAQGPIARGFINTGAGGTAPTIGTGSTGVSAVTWDAGQSRYELTLTGVSYLYNKYVTVITPTCENLPAATNSIATHLVVKFGPGTACNSGGFAYVTYKIA